MADLTKAVSGIFSSLEKFNRGKPLQFAEDILKLRESFTSHREDRLSGYMNRPRDFAAYSSFHLPLHLPEVFWILDTLNARIPLKTPEHILDLGCGPGTAALSAYLWLLNQKMILPRQWTLVDQSRRALQCAQAIHPEPIKILRSNLVGLFKRPKPDQMADWIFLSHVLNEFGVGGRALQNKQRLVDSVLTYLKPGGFLILVEPPLRPATEDLMRLRDDLVDHPELTIVAPCPSGTSLCPMLKQKKGWCYAQPPRSWSQKLGLCPWDTQLMKVAQISLTDPGFSYLVLCRGELKQTRPSQVAVSDDMGDQGWICQGDKLARGRVPFRGARIAG